jgi:hypothetical protein
MYPCAAASRPVVRALGTEDWRNQTRHSLQVCGYAVTRLHTLLHRAIFSDTEMDMVTDSQYFKNYKLYVQPGKTK